MDSLTIKRQCLTYIFLVSAQTKSSIYLIRVPDKLATVRHMVPRLEAFISELPKHSNEFNNVILRLAHRISTLPTFSITLHPKRSLLILGWESSGVVLFTAWNSSRSFPLNRNDNEQSGREKHQFLELFDNRCKEKSITILENLNFSLEFSCGGEKRENILYESPYSVPNASISSRILSRRKTQ